MSPFGTDPPARDSDPAGVVRIELTVHDLPCAGAAAPIEARIRRLHGVRTAYLNPVTERVVVTYDPTQVTADQLRMAIRRDLGMEVSA